MKRDGPPALETEPERWDARRGCQSVAVDEIEAERLAARPLVNRRYAFYGLADAMEFSLLGPLEAHHDGRPLALGGAKQRALLARLLLEPNRTVATERLVDDLWGEDVPPSAVKMIHIYVSHLRKVIPREILRTSPPGYVLRTPSESIDVARFVRLRDEGRAAAVAGDAAGAAERLAQALALWRGPALAEFEEGFARAEAAHLEEARLVCLEERIDADLALGRHADLVGELDALVARWPERGRLRAQFMLALYRSGRHSDALASYRTYRESLDAELGLAPSSELRELERRILSQDPSLDCDAAPSHGPADDAASRASVSDRSSLARRRDPFVGRERELAQLLDILEDVIAGRGSIAAVAGEPGIGKTRLAAELAAIATARGVRVVRGRCHEPAGAPPYWPWAQVLRGLVDDTDPRVLDRDAAGAAADLARLLPGLPVVVDALPADPPVDPQQARFRLFDSIASYLTATSKQRPVLAILDDVQWADPDSLLLLEFLAGELGPAAILVLVTHRDVAISRRHPLSRTLAELHRSPGFEQLTLGGLPEDATRRYIDELVGEHADAAVAGAVHARTQGNPLFIGEFVRLLRQQGALTWTTGQGEGLTRGLPEGVLDVMARRLDQLGHRCKALLEVAALMSGEFDLAELASIEGETASELLECVEAACDAAVIAETQPETGRFAFTHALFEETLIAQLSRARRTALHARIAHALERRGEAAARERAAELASHFAAARPLVGPEPLVRYSLIAGERALATFAYEDAVAIFERAVKARSADAIDDDLAQLLFGLARAQLALRELRDLDDALGNLGRAFDHFARTGRHDRALAVATHPLPPNLLYERAGVARLIERALDLAPPASTTAGHLLAFLGWLRGINHADYEAAHAAFDGALEIATARGDPALEVKTLVNAQYVEMFHLRWSECLDVGRRAAELAVQTGDVRGEMAARGWSSRALVVLGRPQEAEAQAATSLVTAERLRERYWLATSALHNAIPAVLCGRWRPALRHIDHALTARPHDARTLGLRAFVEYQLGDVTTGARDLERLQGLVDRVPPPGPGADYPLAAAFLPLCDHLAGGDEHLAAASVIAEKVLALKRPTPYLTTCARVGLGLIAVDRGDAAAARDIYASLGEGAPMLVLPAISFDRLLGLLAGAAGMVGEAVDHFERALAFCTAAGYHPERIWTMLHLARTLRVRAGDGDDSRAHLLDKEAMSAADTLGLCVTAT